jgi:epoxyqueuosine reductase
MLLSAASFKQKAYEQGFELVGISPARQLDDEARRLEQWLNKGFQGQMRYLENHFDKRIDPRKLVEGAQTVISLLFNYYPQAQPSDPQAPKIARYAYGEDYHHVLKDKLHSLLAWMQKQLGTEPLIGRCFVDSAPVLERDWAKHNGLGWIGKNTLLLHPRKGSYFFLAEIISTATFDQYDHAMKDYCGRCRRCIEACPTQAIDPQGYVMDGSKCISYFTIELKDELPQDQKGKFENWMFGCDICQEVCPWNRFAKPHQEPRFEPHPDLLNMTESDWQEITEDVFKKLFAKSAVKRTKYQGLKRNINFLKKS